MAFDLTVIASEIRAAPIASPYPFELAVAIINDCLRLGGHVPPSSKAWQDWAKPRGARALLVEQAGMLAHILASTSLRAESVACLLERRMFSTAGALESFFDHVAPLTAEMIRANAFRQEEFLRRWIEMVGGVIGSESARESRQRLAQLDYRKTLAEYERAEKARQGEAERRAKMLAEAAKREADARGWRE
ncbi:MAG: hypothetical protein MUF51_05455 [Vicinamibacteria bacterium]|nr:hypothetical protein [Vicinamibacteria bacterium]